MAASILHGSQWFDAEFRIPLLRAPTGSGLHCEGRIAHRFELLPGDTCEIDGVLVTTPVRTAFDIGRVTPEWRGLGNLDALHRATGFSREELVRYIEVHKGWRHIRQLRAIAPLIDGRAESPPESWVRLLIIRGDLPTPDLQIPVVDDTGIVVARADLGYESLKVDIEYDGEEFHSSPSQREKDMARDALLEKLGWKTIRIDRDRLRDDPGGILAEIEAAIHARGGY
jgi:hypothetical protein